MYTSALLRRSLVKTPKVRVEQPEPEMRELGRMDAKIVIAPVQPFRRRLAIDQLPALCADPVCESARVADDDVGVDARGGESERQDWECDAVAASQSTRAVEPQRPNIPLAELGEGALGVVQRRVHRCVREGAAQG